MSISTIRGMQRYLIKNSGFSNKVINDVIIALGYNPNNNKEKDFKELSRYFLDCSKLGAYNMSTGLTYIDENVKFYRKHQFAIVSHMEKTAEKSEKDLISMILNFEEFRTSDDPPTLSNVGKALWYNKLCWSELYELYNSFAWYTLDMVANTWLIYLINNPDVKAKIAA